MWCRDLVAGVLLAGTVGACAVVDPVDPRYDTVNRSLAKARNESILLNIIRSSHDWPMSFTTVPQVNPSMQNVTTVGLPSFLEGPNPQCINLNGGAIGAAGAARCLTPPGSPGRDILFGNQNNLSNATTVSSNFSVASLENGSFYSGLLSPVSLHDLNYFIRQGYSRELLFWLFADSIEIEAGHHVIGYQFDPPYDYGCPPEDPKKRCFREFMEIAVITGLTVEATTVTPGGSKSDGKGGGSDGGGSGGAKGKTEYSRFCFDPVLAERGMKAMNPERLRLVMAKYVDRDYKRSPNCGSPWSPGKEESAQADTLQFHVGPLTFKIVTRSTYSIYQFLGKLLKQAREVKEQAAAPRIEATDEQAESRPNVPRVDEIIPILSTVREDSSLLNIVTQPGEDCFVVTHFIDGLYCVPEKGSANTKRIFALLSQLIALKTTAADLAITPAVRVVQ
jgi:hypothetical protein